MLSRLLKRLDLILARIHGLFGKVSYNQNLILLDLDRSFVLILAIQYSAPSNFLSKRIRAMLGHAGPVSLTLDSWNLACVLWISENNRKPAIFFERLLET